MENEREENNLAFEEARAIILNFYEPLSPEEFQTEAINFKRKIDITRTEKNNIISLYESRRPKNSNWLLRIAGSVLLIATVGMGIYWLSSGPFNNHLADITSETRMIKKETGKGQKMTITFQEGTVVKLNSESSIIYPEEFDGGTRKVMLQERLTSMWLTTINGRSLLTQKTFKPKY